MTPEEIRKLNSPKKFKITNTLNNKEIGRIYRREGGELQRELFEKVIRAVNLAVYELLASGKDFVFPYNMGTLRVMKRKQKVIFKNGKMFANNSVNWKETLRYWSEDEEARKKKKRIYFLEDTFYRIRYTKNNIRTNKLKFYYFRADRGLRKYLSDIMKQGKLETFV